MEINQFILTSNGYLEITKHQNEKVWNAQNHYVEAQSLFIQRNQMVHLKWKSPYGTSTTICIPEQKFKTKRGEIEAKNLKIGDEIEPYMIPLFGSERIFLAIYLQEVKQKQILHGSFEIAIYDQDVICNGIWFKAN